MPIPKLYIALPISFLEAAHCQMKAWSNLANYHFSGVDKLTAITVNLMALSIFLSISRSIEISKIAFYKHIGLIEFAIFRKTVSEEP